MECYGIYLQFNNLLIGNNIPWYDIYLANKWSYQCTLAVGSFRPGGRKSLPITIHHKAYINKLNKLHKPGFVLFGQEQPMENYIMEMKMITVQLMLLMQWCLNIFNIF